MSSDGPRLAGRPAADNRAKRPISPLAVPYGHPIHPILVTVPIGAWIASLVFDIASAFADDPEPFSMGAEWLVAIGLIGALAAALFGFMDLMAIPRGTVVFRTAVTHLALNLGVIALFVASFLIRRGRADTQETSVALIVLSVVALALLSASGALGGTLSYRYGVRVTDEQTQAEGFR